MIQLAMNAPAPTDTQAFLTRLLGKKNLAEAILKANHDPIKTAWNLYNVLTYYSSHVASDQVRDLVENKAADYLVLYEQAARPTKERAGATPTTA